MACAARKAHATCHIAQPPESLPRYLRLKLLATLSQTLQLLPQRPPLLCCFRQICLRRDGQGWLRWYGMGRVGAGVD